MTVANGIAVQAVSGTSRDDLQDVADAALRNWPWPAQTTSPAGAES
jgi:hypothetical protein